MQKSKCKMINQNSKRILTIAYPGQVILAQLPLLKPTNNFAFWIIILIFEICILHFLLLLRFELEFCFGF